MPQPSFDDSSLEPVARQFIYLAAELAKANIFNRRLAQELKNRDSVCFQNIEKEVEETFSRAKLEMQTEIGNILKRYGVHNPFATGKE